MLNMDHADPPAGVVDVRDDHGAAPIMTAQATGEMPRESSMGRHRPAAVMPAVVREPTAALHRGTDDEGNQEAGEAGSGHDVTELGGGGSVLDDLSETAAETGDRSGGSERLPEPR